MEHTHKEDESILDSYYGFRNYWIGLFDNRQFIRHEQYDVAMGGCLRIVANGGQICEVTDRQTDNNLCSKG